MHFILFELKLISSIKHEYLIYTHHENVCEDIYIDLYNNILLKNSIP